MFAGAYDGFGWVGQYAGRDPNLHCYRQTDGRNVRRNANITAKFYFLVKQVPLHVRTDLDDISRRQKLPHAVVIYARYSDRPTQRRK